VRSVLSSSSTLSRSVWSATTMSGLTRAEDLGTNKFVAYTSLKYK